MKASQKTNAPATIECCSLFFRPRLNEDQPSCSRGYPGPRTMNKYRINKSGVVLTCPLYYPGKAAGKLRSKALPSLKIGLNADYAAQRGTCGSTAKDAIQGNSAKLLSHHRQARLQQTCCSSSRDSSSPLATAACSSPLTRLRI